MKLLRVDSSIRVEGSVSRELADVVERTWLRDDSQAEVVHRDLSAGPSLHETWRTAAHAGFVPEGRHTPAMRAALAVAARAADEVRAADAIAIAAPLYNLGVPAALKSWFDLLITDRRFDPRHTPMGQALTGVPVVLLLARGGGYGAGSPREGWDHSTPYLLRLLRDVFGADVTKVVAELTAADLDPAMSALRPLARQSRADALALAEATATALARRGHVAGTDRHAADGTTVLSGA